MNRSFNGRMNITENKKWICFLINIVAKTTGRTIRETEKTAEIIKEEFGYI